MRLNSLFKFFKLHFISLVPSLHQFFLILVRIIIILILVLPVLHSLATVNIRNLLELLLFVFLFITLFHLNHTWVWHIRASASLCWVLLLFGRWIVLLQEYFIFENYFFTKGFNKGCCSCSLLLLLFTFLIFFLLIRSGFSVIICEIDLFSELNTKGTFLDPRSFRFKRDSFSCELLQH